MPRCNVWFLGAALVELIAPYYPEGKNARSPFALETMLRIHFMQQWFNLSDPAMDEAAFQKLAADAKAQCPLSKALTGVPRITLKATLRP